MSTPSVLGAIFGNTLLSGVEPDPEEPDRDRVYVGPRYEWCYVLVDAGSVRLNATGHTFTTLPVGTPIYQDADRCAQRYIRINTNRGES
jgi:hypothetical protein